MEKDTALPQTTPIERETKNEANRLLENIENALVAVAARSPADVDSIEASATRIERAARDLVFALRELARERAAAKES